MEATPAEPDPTTPLSKSLVLACALGATMVPLSVIAREPAALGLVVGSAVFSAAVLAVRHPRGFWWLTLAAAPLAIDWSTPVQSVRLTLPLELMLVLGPIGVLMSEGRKGLPGIGQLRHPLSILLVGQMGWMVVAALMSLDPLVSAKSAAARLIYLVSLYVLGLRFLVDVRSLLRLVSLVGCGLTMVGWLALGRNAMASFDPQAVYASAQPFFQNRGELCSLVALWLPLAVAAWADRRALGLRALHQTILATSLITAALTIVVLRAGAAFCSVVLALLVAYFAKRLPPGFMAGLIAASILATTGATVDIVRFRSDVADPGIGAPRSPVRAALLGTFPLSTESFTERATRWAAAARMARSRPLFGFGPAMFERNYAAFQLPRETTRRTTWLGDEGDAHSEPLSVLAEQGVPGLFLLCGVFAIAFYASARISRSGSSGSHLPRELSGCVTVFMVLNGLNSFLDTSKVVFLFWALCAAIVNFDQASNPTPGATNREVH